MFQKMCCAIISLVLVATPSIYPEAHLEVGSNNNTVINILSLCCQCAIVELLTNMVTETSVVMVLNCFFKHPDKPFVLTFLLTTYLLLNS